MTRAEILKEFFKKTVLTVVIAYLLFTWGKRMFLWLTPSGRSSISFTIGIIAVNFIVDGMVGIVVPAW